MKRTACAVLSLGLLLSGCATEEYVRQQTSPLAERLGALETRTLTIEGRLNQLSGRPALTTDDRASIDSAREMAQKALDRTDSLSADLKQMGSDVARAEAAARRAEAAAEKAGRAEKGARKAFELEQKK